MTWQPPVIGSRPIVVIGAGVLGRRIASVFLAGGYNVNTYDPSPASRQEAARYVAEHKDEFTAILPKSSPIPQSGEHATFEDLALAVAEAWLVIEAVPEKLELKIDMFGELDRLCPGDCIIGSNSSSYKSSLMLGKVGPERRRLICNVHFTMPPEVCTVELMTDGVTEPAVFPFLSGVLRQSGMLPVTAKKESTGFVFNRLWAAVKREVLTILAEGVSDPGQIDMLWRTMFKAEVVPCKLMDQIGLDTVAFIEDNYIQERNLDSSLTVDWLRREYLDQGRTGLKSGKGGLYQAAPQMSGTNGVSDGINGVLAKAVYVLDVGLGGNLKDISTVATNGKILRLDPKTGKPTPIVTGLPMPDGIDVSESAGRIFFTNMGTHPSVRDGSVMSSNLDGSDLRTIVPEGHTHTPKQLVVVDELKKVYFCDREGTSVHCCDFDGKNHRVLVQRKEDPSNLMEWCVGITVDVGAGKMYWTQKGPSKAGKGRIYRANLAIPDGEAAGNRSDIELLFENLPEPIDLEMDSEAKMLYWTDRGEHPVGSSLNRASVAGQGSERPEILARHFHEPIGLKLDGEKGCYVTDLGGSVYWVDLTREKKKIHSDDRCYTGITLA